MEAEVSAAVEGDVDRTAITRLVAIAGLRLGPVYVTGGKRALEDRLLGYNEAARFAPWVVLVDLDQDSQCAPEEADRLLPEPGRHMVLRVVVRSIESWFLADREEIASFLRVRRSIVPDHPDNLDRPKEALVDLARHSRRPAIAAEMVPRPASGRAVGPAYNGRVIEFARERWDPERASARSPSLARTLARLREPPWRRLS